MLVKYVITRPSAALFLNHIFALSLCSSVVLVEVFLEGDVRTSARGPHPTKGNHSPQIHFACELGFELKLS